jgi:hypothetical protein
VNYEAIEYLRTNNVLRGYTDGTFRADTRITRAEFVSLLTNPFFLNGQGQNNCVKSKIGSGSTTVFYSDVHTNDWFADDVCTATVDTIIGGYPDGTFKPNHSITFAEAAKVSANVLALNVKDTASVSDPKWYTAYVLRLADLHAIPTTIRRFDQVITRGQMAEIVFRLKTANMTKASAKYNTLR